MMPTETQVRELINTNNTIYTWTSINGVNGFIFISKKDTSNYILLLPGGEWSSNTHNYAGSQGYYWTTKYDSSSYAHFLCLSVGNWGPESKRLKGYSFSGACARPVAPKRPW